MYVKEKPFGRCYGFIERLFPEKIGLVVTFSARQHPSPTILRLMSESCGLQLFTWNQFQVTLNEGRQSGVCLLDSG